MNDGDCTNVNVAGVDVVRGWVIWKTLEHHPTVIVCKRHELRLQTEICSQPPENVFCRENVIAVQGVYRKSVVVRWLVSVYTYMARHRCRRFSFCFPAAKLCHSYRSSPVDSKPAIPEVK